MRKLTSLLMLALFGVLIFVSSCKDDDEDPQRDAPSVTAPSAVTDVENGATGLSIDFTVSIDDALTATYSATGSGVTINNPSGDVSGGTVTINFDAGTNAGAASITLTVTDSDGESDEATAVLNVLEPGDAPVFFNENGAIPAEATLVVGQVLAVSGVEVSGEDGIASVTVTVDGAAFSELDSIYDGAPTTAEYEFSVNTGILEPGNYLVEFTATDLNGSTDRFSHILTVEGLAFNELVETIDDNDTEDDPSDDIVYIEYSGSINTDFELTSELPDGQTIAYYVLGGRVKVTSGATLTIPAGSVLKGEGGGGQSASALLVTRGSKLMAEGMATAPIIFTSVSDDITMQDVAAGDFISPNLESNVNGLWGGVIILGSAPISVQNENDEDVLETQIEGIPSSDQDGLYGGENKEDNSGVITYISIRHGGTNIGSGNEINGLTLGGVGSGTTIENVEIVANQDDGIEWFGGTVSITNALVWNCADDGMDTDQAWNGTCNNFLVVTPQGGSAFELDGPEGNYIDQDNPNHNFTNGLVYVGDNVDALIDFDANTNVVMDGVYFYGFPAANQPFVEEYQAMIDFEGSTSDVANFEYSGLTETEATNVFVDIPDTKYSSVAENSNTVGPTDQTGFEWTWASQSGALGSIGL